MTQPNPACQIIPAHDLATQSPAPLTVLPNLDTLFQHFARTVADEIAANNQWGRPTRLILPIGPVGQFPLLAAICNAESITL